MAKQIGMGGGVTAGSTECPVTEWTINVNNDTQDVTDTGSGGWQAMLAGVNSAETTFTAFWGGAVSVLSTLFAIGTTVPITLTVGTGGGVFAGSFVIKTFSVKNNAKTPVEFSCTGTSTGAVTMPS
ncbi:Phage major tail protein 2 [Gemmata obscuriglobus]|uniref:Phage tail protein n=1 Tax=Gemmata obscuriglobus TaxID=114 RepID=A0A2Z3H4J0_9BACT|nr:phage tail tube protein [Gemmata obscuriglobus]AWM39781.1 hypothetical protein C1280_24100 [Gemmata obscuriglobus]QEG27104.1 Phage major tail protein 2 [Gemmata obscuriglobus]VTS03607.1 : Phage_tail_2 [Gemmata obscuriglobus UQM 2246]